MRSFIVSMVAVAGLAFAGGAFAASGADGADATPQGYAPNTVAPQGWSPWEGAPVQPGYMTRFEFLGHAQSFRYGTVRHEKLENYLYPGIEEWGQCVARQSTTRNAKPCLRHERIAQTLVIQLSDDSVIRVTVAGSDIDVGDNVIVSEKNGITGVTAVEK